jgi:hypothetical protein
MSGYACPKGHDSSEPDFCSECGAKIQGAPPSASPGPLGAAAAPASGACPDCAAPRTDTSSKYCEVCGYNFSTGTHGNIPGAPVVPPAPAPPPPPPPPAPPPVPIREWTLVTEVDASLRDPAGPEAPVNTVPVTFKLDKPVSLIGRKSEKRGIVPEVSLEFDDGVSHRHALLTRGDDGSLVLRDIGSANGTRVNGADVQSMADRELHEGDQITLGRWTRITVRAV